MLAFLVATTVSRHSGDPHSVYRSPFSPSLRAKLRPPSRRLSGTDLTSGQIASHWSCTPVYPPRPFTLQFTLIKGPECLPVL